LIKDVERLCDNSEHISEATSIHQQITNLYNKEAEMKKNLDSQFFNIVNFKVSNFASTKKNEEEFYVETNPYQGNDGDDKKHDLSEMGSVRSFKSVASSQRTSMS